MLCQRFAQHAMQAFLQWRQGCCNRSYQSQGWSSTARAAYKMQADAYNPLYCRWLSSLLITVMQHAGAASDLSEACVARARTQLHQLTQRCCWRLTCSAADIMHMHRSQKSYLRPSRSACCLAWTETPYLAGGRLCTSCMHPSSSLVLIAMRRRLCGSLPAGTLLLQSMLAATCMAEGKSNPELSYAPSALSAMPSK